MDIELTDLALASLEDIAAYVQSNFSDKVARKAIEGIRTAIHSLGNSPNAGRQISELKSYGTIRCLIYKQNQIYYRLLPNRIQILIVWDGRQDPNRLLNLLLHFFSSARSRDLSR